MSSDQILTTESSPRWYAVAAFAIDAPMIERIEWPEIALINSANNSR